MFEYLKSQNIPKTDYTIEEWSISEAGIVYHYSSKCDALDGTITESDIEKSHCYCGVKIPNKVKVISKLRQL